jgi:hypothetical protein
MSNPHPDSLNPPPQKRDNRHLKINMTGKPAVYFHVEFGVSWTPGQPSKTKQATYMSRNMRNQPGQVPRRIQHANSDFMGTSSQRYLTAQDHRTTAEGPSQIYEYYAPTHQYASRRHATSPRHADHHREHHREHHHREHHHHHHAHAVRAPGANHPGRRSRSLNRSSQEQRGKSAPPPLNTANPWEAEPEPMTATILPSKPDLPVSPHQAEGAGFKHSQFNLEHDDAPWSASFPPGFMLPLDSEHGEGMSRTAGDRGTFGAPPRRSENQDRGRVTEIESLAAALMTVDNGFEDQWWNQGPRLVNIGGELKSASALEEMLVARERAGSVDTAEEIRAARARFGSIVSPLDDAEPSMISRRASLPTDSPVPSIVDIVSPVSDVSSPGPSFRVMRRTLTTRSDELHM